MEFTIDAFTQKLYDLLLESNQFPFMRDEELDRKKHRKRAPLHLRDAIRSTTVMVAGGENIRSFDFGNESLELNHPYYHILEDAPYIRKRNRGTKKTKGSQALVEDKAKRDYGRVSWNGKTFSKEYSRNVRGSRKRLTSVSHWTEDYGGKKVFVNREASSYANTHYKYIENILNGGVLDKLALEFGLKRARTVDAGLGEEWEMQRIMDMFGSHDIY